MQEKEQDAEEKEEASNECRVVKINLVKVSIAWQNQSPHGESLLTFIILRVLEPQLFLTHQVPSQFPTLPTLIPQSPTLLMIRSWHLNRPCHTQEYPFPRIF